jgi:hypothetical protein
MTDKSIQYSEKVGELADDGINTIEESLWGKKIPTINKSEFRKGEYSKQVDNILEAVKRNKTERQDVINEHVYPFTKQISDNHYNIFTNLDDVKKNRISEIIRESKKMKVADVEELIESINEDSDITSIISSMPKRLYKVWENMSNKNKAGIISLFRMKGFTSHDEMVDYWDQLNINQPNKVDESLIDSHAPSIKGLNGIALGYDEDSIDRLLGL